MHLIMLNSEIAEKLTFTSVLSKLRISPHSGKKTNLMFYKAPKPSVRNCVTKTYFLNMSQYLYIFLDHANFADLFSDIAVYPFQICFGSGSLASNGCLLVPQQNFKLVNLKSWIGKKVNLPLFRYSM